VKINSSYNKIFFTTIFSLILFLNTDAQTSDSSVIRSIYNEALLKGKSYEDLRELCKNIGARLSGSAQAEMAVKWSEQKMLSYGFDKVTLQPIMVPHWERGNSEAGWFQVKDKIIKVNLLALGGSVGTNGLISGEVFEVNSLNELKKKNTKDIKNKIVFINQKMDDTFIQTFKAYGSCYPIRGNGAVEASRMGAKAVIIRSLSLSNNEHPHTGSLNYNDSVPKIPAVAISTQDADELSTALKSNQVTFSFETDCRLFPDSPSFNVIGELKGTEYPDEIITIGGHLDSWDTGEGAHDDGAGVIHCLEALRILKTLNIKPKHTIRVVFFMNEENGNAGGKSYAKIASEKKEKHIAALESDRGGFAPRGFVSDGNDNELKWLQSIAPNFLNYDLHIFEKGGGGVDIGPLKNYFSDIVLYSFVPDSQRYFDFHHAPSDVFENVNKRELELGSAAIASFIYLLDKK
jgi:carboxypeptidase Q